uniref:Uncharacterized protein n=1 Tax=viral metagenome TaxID=1070528 RepID=A0A6H1Z9E9_9ZZZZ
MDEETTGLGITISIMETIPPHPAAKLIDGNMFVGRAECKKELRRLANARIEERLARLFPPKAK